MTHAAAFSSPWYVASLRRFSALVASVADNLESSLQPSPQVRATLQDDRSYESVLARAAEESLANTRHRLSRYY